MTVGIIYILINKLTIYIMSHNITLKLMDGNSYNYTIQSKKDTIETMLNKLIYNKL